MAKNNNKKANNDYILQVKNLKKYFPITSGFFSKVVGNVKAVDNVSFDLERGDTVGVVGESGCGKTTTGRSLIRLLEPTAGEIIFNGKDIMKMSGNELKKQRKDMQIIFQDPYSSLNPRKTVMEIIGEGIEFHGIASGKEKEDLVATLMTKVGLDASYVNRYPHEFSGGQRQRIGIARAIAINPQLIICDEPVSALDVSVQAQVINLLIDLKEEYGLSYLFIAHDLSVVKHISDKIIVMYLGKMVEYAESNDLFKKPMHPYTQALLSAIPNPNPKNKSDRIVLEGDMPTPINPPPGCHFHPRCRFAKAICKKEEPPVKCVDGNHFFKCHFDDLK